MLMMDLTSPKILLKVSCTLTAALILWSTGADGADIVVTSNSNSGAGSLRQAILDAEAGDRIFFDSALAGQTITLTEMLPLIDEDLTIDGSGAPELQIDGGGTNRVFFVQSGTVQISTLQITGASAEGGDGAGSALGGIGGGGGGLGAGGAVFVDSGATVTLSNIDIENSSAVGGDGGLFDSAGTGGAGGGGGLGGDGGSGGDGGGGGGGGLGGVGGTGGDLGGGGGGGISGSDGDGSGGDGFSEDGDPTVGGGGGGAASSPGGEGAGTAGDGGTSGVAAGGGGGGGGFAGEDGEEFDAVIGGAGGDGGYGGGGGGSGTDATGSPGDGGDFGGGGGAGEGSTTDGGDGGDGGGGGGSVTAAGGDGGFGGGGGAGAASGSGGTYAGDAGIEGGGGGAALGGAVFVRQGGSLTLQNTDITGSSLTAGEGAGVDPNAGEDGETAGEAIFLDNVDLGIAVSSGRSVLIADSIADNSLNGADSALTKSGDGELILSANNTYAGVTQIDEGRLELQGSLAGGASIAADGELGGTGTIAGDVTSAGGLSAGNAADSIGTLSFADDLSVTAGQVEVDIRGAINPTTPGIDNDLYDVVGSATLSGGTVVVEGQAGSYTSGTIYTFLNAGGGVTGTFAGITDNLPFFDAMLLDGDPGSFRLDPDTDASFAELATSCNQRSVGRYLDRLGDTGPGDLSTVIDALRSTTAGQIQSGLEQLGGQIYPTLVSAQLQHTSFNLTMLRNQLALDLPAWTKGERATGWVRGYGLSGDADRDECGTNGFGYQLGGTEMAIQRSLARGFAVGLFGNFAWSEVELDQLEQRGDIDTYQFGGSFQYVGEFAYLLGIGGGGYQSYDVDRDITASTLDRSTGSEFDGHQAFGYLEQGTLLGQGPFVWNPHIAMQYINLHQGDFAESGADAVNLMGESLDADSLRSILGLAVAQSNITTLGRATTELRAGWMHEYLDTRQSLESRFAGESETVTVQGVDLGRDWAVVSVNLQWSLFRNSTLLSSYETQLNDYQAFHTGTVGLETRW